MKRCKKGKAPWRGSHGATHIVPGTNVTVAYRTPYVKYYTSTSIVPSCYSTLP